MEQNVLAAGPLQDAFTIAAGELAARHLPKPVAGGLKRLRAVALIAIILPFLMLNAHAAHWYVRPSSAGTANGSDWNNAWSMANLNSNWGSVSAGDTVWIAGGTYVSQLLPTANGTAASPIRVQRPRTTDATPTAAAGWSPSFDSQIVMTPINASGIYVGGGNQGHNMIFDGRVDAGWKIVKDNGTAGSYPACVQYTGAANTTNVLFLNMDLVGPFDVTAPVLSGINNYHACISLTPRTVPDGVRWITFSNTLAHGGVNLVNILGGWGSSPPNAGGQYITFDRCKFYNNMASSASFHANMFEIRDCGNITWRYCEFHTWLVEGIMPYGSVKGPLYFYGNIFRDNVGSVARCFEPFTSWQAFIYNNTFVNIGGVGVYSRSGGGSWASGSSARNNLYWNSGMGAMPPPQDYEFRGPSVSVAGLNSIISGSSPFINLIGKDFQIVSTVSSTLPRNKGVALAAIYNKDKDGKLRGADGAWDIGAYEYGVSGPVTNPVIWVSPGSLDFGTVALGSTRDLTFTVQNVGAGTLTGTASVSAPFIIVSGGTYSLGSNQSQTVTVRYSPTVAGSHSQTLTLTGAGGASLTVSGAVLVVLPGLSFEAEAGAMTGPFTVSSGSIYQVSETGATTGGRAAYNFSITSAGDYLIQAVVNAPNEAANSFFVSIDGEPQDPYMVWQIPITSGFETRTVSWQGNGTWDNSQFVPKVFTLTAGTHQLVIRGREANTLLDRVAVVATAAKPQPPSALRVLDVSAASASQTSNQE